jgi:3-oxoadipate enol-lactonase
MHVEESGTGPTVLAIHGLGGGAWFFADLARELPTIRLLAVDLTGTGRSPGTASMAGWVNDLESLVAARSREPVVLLGHSMGTIIALEAWRAWPQRIRALVLTGGLPQVRPAIRERLSQRITALDDAPSLAGWGPRVSPGVFSPATAREHPDIVARFEQRFESEAIDRYLRCTRILLDADARHLAPTVAVRTLVVTGEDDQYAPPDSAAAFAGTIPDARFEVMPGCGHLPFLEQPRAFAAVMNAFVRTC